MAGGKEGGGELSPQESSNAHRPLQTSPTKSLHVSLVVWRTQPECIPMSFTAKSTALSPSSAFVAAAVAP